MSDDVLFTAADVAEMRAFSDANLPHAAVLRRGVRAFEPGGTRGGITWDPDPQWTEPARFSPASAPQERLTAGALATTSDDVVATRAGVAIPADVGDTYYRLEVTHDAAEIPSPLVLYRVRATTRSFRMLTKMVGTTEAPK